MKQQCPICEKSVPLHSILKHIKKHGSGGNKYNARKVEVDGFVFDSKLESERYIQLKLLADNGLIRDLVLQPKLPCFVGGKLFTTYTADFSYFDNRDLYVVEDTKGMKTEAYKLRKKLAEALYNIKIIEVTREMM